MSEPVGQVLRHVWDAAKDAKRQFPGDGDDAKERRALKAALHVAELLEQFGNPTKARAWLEDKFGVSERQIRRAEKILVYPEIVRMVLKGPVSVTNASHVIEHAGVDMLRIAWACATPTDRQRFLDDHATFEPRATPPG